MLCSRRSRHARCMASAASSSRSSRAAEAACHRSSRAPRSWKRGISDQATRRWRWLSATTAAEMRSSSFRSRKPCGACTDTRAGKNSMPRRSGQWGSHTAARSVGGAYGEQPLQSRDGAQQQAPSARMIRYGLDANRLDGKRHILESEVRAIALKGDLNGSVHGAVVEMDDGIREATELEQCRIRPEAALRHQAEAWHRTRRRAIRSAVSGRLSRSGCEGARNAGGRE